MRLARISKRALWGFPVILALFFACGGQPTGGAYRVGVEKISDEENSIVRTYTIETSSRRTFALARNNGRDSTSLAPDTMRNERVGKAEATVTVTLEDNGDGRHASVDLRMKTGFGTSHFARELPLPSGATLASVLTETEPVGDMTDKITLLRLESEAKYLEVVVE